MSFGIELRKNKGKDEPINLQSLYVMYYMGEAKNAFEICSGLLANRENDNNIYLLDLFSLTLYGVGEYNRAIEVAERNRQLCFQANDEWLAFQQLLRQARCWVALESYQIAKKKLEEVEAELPQVEDKWAEGLCYMLQGLVFNWLVQYDKGLDLMTKAYKTYERYGDVEDMALCCINAANICKLKSEYGKALQYLDKAIQLKEVYSKSIEYSVSEGYGKILVTYDGYIRLPRKTHHSLSGVYMAYAGTLYSLGNPQSALEYCQKALDLKKTTDDRAGIAAIYNTIGISAINASQLDTAEYYLNEGINQLGENDSIYTKATMTMNLGEVYLRRQQYAKSEEYLERAMQMFNLVEEQRHVMHISGRLAHVYVEQGKKEVARQYLEKGISYAKEFAFVADLVEMQVTLAKALMPSGISQVRELLNQTLLLADQYGLKNFQMNIHKELSSIYKLEGSTTLALYHFERFHQLKEEIHTEESDRQLKNMLILHEVEQHKRKAEESQKALRTLKEELEKKTRELTTFALRITEKQELLDTLHNGLRGILDAQPHTKDAIAMELLRIVESADTRQQDWREFSRHFAELHQHFMENMAKLFPDLSPTELKVCALLRLNMSTKQIAGIMHVSDRAVENHRLRLRKKLGLHRDDNLTKKLLEF